MPQRRRSESEKTARREAQAQQEAARKAALQEPQQATELDRIAREVALEAGLIVPGPRRALTEVVIVPAEI